jgi:hypothetical protein
MLDLKRCNETAERQIMCASRKLHVVTVRAHATLLHRLFTVVLSALSASLWFIRSGEASHSRQEIWMASNQTTDLELTVSVSSKTLTHSLTINDRTLAAAAVKHNTAGSMIGQHIRTAHAYE